MNIVKYHDIIINEDTFFNDNLKGKYAYAVNMLWVFPFDKLSTFMFHALSDGSVTIETFQLGIDYVLYNDYKDYIDTTATDNANSIDKFLYLNTYAPDSDITIDELKMFRTWLATQLLDTNGFLEEFVETHKEFNLIMLNAMLEYYKHEMSDSATVFLSLFAPGSITNLNFMQGVNTCGCTGHNNTIIGAPITCDPLATYINEIYKYMVRCFSELDFWNNEYLHDTIVPDFKKYIDGILSTNLPLASSVPNKYEDCTCINTDNDLQKRYQSMLYRLSTALQYIIDNEVSGHKNFITTALNEWAVYLYERMRWN